MEKYNLATRLFKGPKKMIGDFNKVLLILKSEGIKISPSPKLNHTKIV